MGVWKKVAQRQLWAEDDLSSGAGVLPVAKSSGRALLNLRSSEVNEPLTFSVWGGYSDEEDAGPDQTALREFEEESGYSGSVELLGSREMETDELVYVTFLGLIPEEFDPILTWESEDCRWVTYSELVSLKPDLHPKFQTFVNSERTLLQEFMVP